MSEFGGWYARLDAPEGAGKTTQIELAKAYAEEKDIDAVFVHEPGGTEFGKEIREMLLHRKEFSFSPQVELALYTADRIHLDDTVIVPALKANKLVISDRGVESGMGYQAGGGKMEVATVREITRLLLPEHYNRPDALALLSLSRATQRIRLEKRHKDLGRDKIESRGEDYFDRVHAAYKEMEKLEYAHTVDAERAPEEIFEDLKPILFGPFLK